MIEVPLDCIVTGNRSINIVLRQDNEGYFCPFHVNIVIYSISGD